MEHQHRSTLKQQNKQFKSRHATKGSIKDKSKGKVESQTLSIKNAAKVTKAGRKNQSKMMQQRRKQELVEANRLFHNAPKIVAMIPLCPDIDVASAISALFECVGQSFADAPVLNLKNEFKQSIQFVAPQRSLLSVLDSVKVADYVVFLMSAEVEVDKFGDLVLTSIKAQGLPSVYHIVQHLERHDAKKQFAIRKSLLSFVSLHFPGDQKLYSAGLNQIQECVNLLRQITAQRPKPVIWRDEYSYILADHVEHEAGDLNSVTLKVTGYVRGGSLSANQLVHIPYYGDFQISSIWSAPTTENSRAMDVLPEELEIPVPDLQESLQSENSVDEMDAEQTWPTEEELNEGDAERAKMERKVHRVPKGTSSYQAAWIIESDEEDSEDDNGMSVDEPQSSIVQHIGAEADIASDEEEYEELALEEKDGDFDNNVDANEELTSYEELKKQRELQDDLEFPDEIDTPRDTPARVRFQRYRGLKSFRSSPWDAYENLPKDYAKIFQFANVKQTYKTVLRRCQEEGVAPGTRVTVNIANVPESICGTYDNFRPFTIFGLLYHEQKVSLLNLLVTRPTPVAPSSSTTVSSEDSYIENQPIRSKDPLILQCGFRRYIVKPIYSSHTPPPPNGIYRFERFFHIGKPTVATVYAPIQFGQGPVILFSALADGETKLVATGSVLNMDVKRIIAKRLILTGHPFKINKRSAVIRFMFFNPKDVLYFKPVQLVTKLGRIGHIRESVGTHGYMKCIFDGQIRQEDTVCMHLYKRVFPKWNTKTLSLEGLQLVNPPKESNEDAMFTA
ncbi:hypothetical protein BJ742DRAFT_310548 [Cladochytrium replicatum]|nr:hypothetical protein BJ742DRAFT_310548 [Cladochytrium replicatum]